MDPETSKRGKPKHHQVHANSLRAWETQVLPTLTERERAVHEVIAAHPGGLTMEEVAAIMRVGWHTVSGRPKNMKAKGAIRGTGKNRGRSEVLVSTRPVGEAQQDLFGSAA
jgi:DNA-binding CsgD family transcriptional regulator